MRLLLGLLALLWATPALAAYQFTDIACETTTTAGTGTIDLAGAKSGGYLVFVTAITSGNTVPYQIITGTGATRKVETGFGVFTDASPDTLTRVAQWSSDGSGAELTLAGESTVCISPIAGLWADADKGDITTSNGFQTWAIDADSIALTTDTTGNYVADVADGTGIDGTASGEGATYTPTLDLTEISSGTWGAGSFTAFTFDAGATDPVLTFGSGTLTMTNISPLTITNSNPHINLIDTDTNADSGVSANSSVGGLTLYADINAESANTLLLMTVDGTTETQLSSSAFLPGTNDGNALGTTNTRWADLFLADGGVINMGTTSSRATLTHDASTDSITIAADPDNATATSVVAMSIDGTTEFSLNGTNLNPGADGGNTLGASGTEWGSLFLNTGGVINFEAGDVTITHSANDLAFAGVTGDYSFDDTVGVTGSVTASIDVTATAGDVTSGDDVIAGDDVLISADGVINFESGDCTMTDGTNTLTVTGCILAMDDLSSIAGQVFNMADNNLDQIMVWDDSAAQVIPMPLATMTTEASPAAGDYVLIYGAEGDLRKSDWSTLPGTDVTGKQTISLMSGAGTIPSGGAIAGCSPISAFDSGSNDVFMRQCSFSASADNAIYFTVDFPKNADETVDLTAEVVWTSATTTDATDDVIWTGAVVCFSNDDAINGNAFPTVDTVTDTQTAAGDLLITGSITAMTPAGTWAELDNCVLRITRDADNASDNFNGTAELISVRLHYTNNAGTDD